MAWASGHCERLRVLEDVAMLNATVYENSRPDGIGVLEILNGRRRREDGSRRFVPLKRTELAGEVAGPLASLRLLQTFGYSRAQCDKVLEAVYRFPLPGDAAVSAVRVRFGEVEIRAELAERGEAAEKYEAARKQGRQAALATRESPDVFTLHVAGIQPDQDVVVETAYVQLAQPEGVGWSLRIPLTTAPRYVRSDELTSRHAHGQPLCLLRDPGHRFSLDLSVREAATVESATHPLEVTGVAHGVRVRLRDGEVTPDRDCVLTWRPPQQEQRPALQVLLYDDRMSGHLYSLALLAPPASASPERVIPREAIVLVDRSGSMEGAKWQAADWAVKRLLYGLTERDTFAVGLFHNTTRWFSPKPVPADSRTVGAAVRFLEAHTDSGGTELGVALEQALALERTNGHAARHVLIITDAQVSDEGRILRLADEKAKDPARRRISILCIDAAPNSSLARQLAERGGGVAKFLTSAPEAEDITTALDAVLDAWSQPVWTGLRLEVNRPQARTSEQAVASVLDLGDLPMGRTVWVAGRVASSQAKDLTFRVLDAEQHEVAACRVESDRDAAAPSALKALFGARRILGLEFLIQSGYDDEQMAEPLTRLGYDPAAVLAPTGRRRKVYAENNRREAEERLRALLVREALDYGLACSETAFVAVRTESGQPVEGAVLVANALPAGWSEEFLAAGPSPRLACSCEVMPMRPPKAPRLHDACCLSPEFSEPALCPNDTVVFSGIPHFSNHEAVLVDSTRPEDNGRLPDGIVIHGVEVRFCGQTPPPASLGQGLSLLIFVADLSRPRAKVRLADLVRQDGQRPLNLIKGPGQVLQIVLADPAGVWQQNTPTIEVALDCEAIGPLSRS